MLSISDRGGIFWKPVAALYIGWADMPNTTGTRSFADELAALNQWHFFREFVYSQTTFRPIPSQEVELADNLVCLGEIMIGYQLKEREQVAGADAESERRWFENKVLGKATRQIRDTVKYLRDHEVIELQNARGHRSQVTFSAIRQFHKLVVYLPHEQLPAECRAIKCHLSTTVGIIHVISGHDYLGIVRTLLTPAEVADYLAFREKLISHWSADVLSVPETALVGQYLCGDFDERPSIEYVDYLKRLEHHADDWDMSGIITKFPDRVTTDNASTDYYPIVRELSLLKRDELRQFKQRFQISLEKARADEFARPYRMAVPRTGCGFVFIPVTKGLLPRRQVGLVNLTLAHKYDQRLSKCVGVSIADDVKPWFNAKWCYTEFPWEEDSEMDKLLNEGSPFREVKHVTSPRYSFDTEEGESE